MPLESSASFLIYRDTEAVSCGVLLLLFDFLKQSWQRLGYLLIVLNLDQSLISTYVNLGLMLEHFLFSLGFRAHILRLKLGIAVSVGATTYIS